MTEAELKRIEERLELTMLATLRKSVVPKLVAEVRRLREEIEMWKRHWIEDDRDLNELIAENEVMRKQIAAIGIDSSA